MLISDVLAQVLALDDVEREPLKTGTPRRSFMEFRWMYLRDSSQADAALPVQMYSNSQVSE